MEYTREIKITIEKDTNKDTYKVVVIMKDEESVVEFIERVKEIIDETLLSE